MTGLVVETARTSAPTIGIVSSARSFDGLPVLDLNRLPAVRCEAGWIGGSWLQAASLTGRSHMQNGTASSGQDVYGYLRVDEPTPLTVLAVADGLGSRPRSHVGATLAVRLACDEMMKLGVGLVGLGDDALVDLSHRVNGRLLAAAGQGWRDVGTTLAACGLVPRGRGYDVVGVRIGDPDAFILSADRKLRSLWREDASERGALNVVGACIPQEDDQFAVAVARELVDDDALGLVLLSDGVANDVAASPEIEAWCLSRWASPLDAFSMADTLRYDCQGSGDDRTAVVLLLDPGRSAGPVDTTLVQESRGPSSGSIPVTPTREADPQPTPPPDAPGEPRDTESGAWKSAEHFAEQGRQASSNSGALGRSTGRRRVFVIPVAVVAVLLVAAVLVLIGRWTSGG